VWPRDGTTTSATPPATIDRIPSAFLFCAIRMDADAAESSVTLKKINKQKTQALFRPESSDRLMLIQFDG